jgi:hypothetical protein
MLKGRSYAQPARSSGSKRSTASLRSNHLGNSGTQRGECTVIECAFYKHAMLLRPPIFLTDYVWHITHRGYQREFLLKFAHNHPAQLRAAEPSLQRIFAKSGGER